jgi:beta-N-acetylhexosaminidase
MVAPVIFGCAGPHLTEEELWLFHEAQPWGFILFDRNIVDVDQVRHLTSDLRDTVDHTPPIFIDQEGGRRATRLRPPLATEWEDASVFLERFDSLDDMCEAMQLRYRIIAAEMLALGIDVNCAPILDISRSNTHPIIADRSYGTSYDEVTAIGRAVADGLMAGGVLPVIKHVPGHGLATVDSHKDLPVVDANLATLEAIDFAPFRDLSDLPMAMTAHVQYDAIDPVNCATQSRDVIDAIRNEIGFDGLLISDDITMSALRRPMRRRALNALAAGCDIVLHCNGDLVQMQRISRSVPNLSGDSLRRAEDALAVRQAADDFNAEAALARLEHLSAGALEYAGGPV